MCDVAHEMASVTEMDLPGNIIQHAKVVSLFDVATARYSAVYLLQTETQNGHSDLYACILQMTYCLALHSEGQYWLCTPVWMPLHDAHVCRP